MKRLFGLIGYPLSHSFSKQYFDQKFKEAGIENSDFINLEIQHLDELPALLKRYPELKGIAVTIPHKEAILHLLKDMDEVVRTIGACNCVNIINGDLYGYNTDVTGFERSITPLLKPYHNKALILGRGGAAKAVSYVLDKLSIEHLFVERVPKDMKSISYALLSGRTLQDYHLIINTTPLGMYPQTDTYPPIPYDAITHLHYLFDLTYNPEKTIFLTKGQEMGATIKNGYDMLVIQAEENWRIWNR